MLFTFDKTLVAKPTKIRQMSHSNDVQKLRAITCRRFDPTARKQRLYSILFHVEFFTLNCITEKSITYSGSWSGQSSKSISSSSCSFLNQIDTRMQFFCIRVDDVETGRSQKNLRNTDEQLGESMNSRRNSSTVVQPAHAKRVCSERFSALWAPIGALGAQINQPRVRNCFKTAQTSRLEYTLDSMLVSAFFFCWTRFC
jgi:hypothetical protein